MSIGRWDPFKDLLTLQERMNRLFEESLAHRQADAEAPPRGTWAPMVDIYETAGEFVMEIEVGGIELSDIQVESEDGVLTIRGERKGHPDVPPDTYQKRERPYGPFQRSFNLPGGTAQERLRAKYQHGILRIEIPKQEERKAKAVHIEVQ